MATVGTSLVVQWLRLHAPNAGALGKKLVAEERVPFKCEVAYAALYPHGFESHCQGIHILLIFDGRTVELPKFIAEYVQKKIEKKALNLVDKKARNASKKQEFLGKYEA